MPRPEDSGGPPHPCLKHLLLVPNWVSLCCLRCTLKPSASAISLFRSCTSTSGCATTPTAYRILCLRFAPLVRRGSHNSARDARLDTGEWLTLTRQGLSPCKIRRALPGAITTKLCGANEARSLRPNERIVRCSWMIATHTLRIRPLNTFAFHHLANDHVI